MERAWTKGWIAAAIALAAILILAIDVAQKQSRPVAHTGTKTVAAAQAAGASVTPSDPKLPENPK
jgi:hypothetical protein